MEYEAYLYEIVIGKPDGVYRYVGWNVGLAEGDYFHSIKNKEMLEILKEDWAKHPDTRERNILAKGDCYEMAYKEWKILSKPDPISGLTAKNNPYYYNSNNGGGPYLKKFGNVEKISEILDDIKNKKYLGEPMTLDQIEKCDIFQVRDIPLNQEHSIHFTDVILDNNGNMTEWDPLLLLENYEGKNGELHTFGGGVHTIKSAQRANKKKKVTAIPTQYLPKTVWKDLTTKELIGLLKALNPKVKKSSLPESDEGLEAYIVDNYKNHGVPIKHPCNIEYLKLFNLTKKQIRYRLKKAENQINEVERMPVNSIRIDWTDTTKVINPKTGLPEENKRQKELKKKFEQSIKEGYVPMYCSSGQFKYDVLHQLMHKHPNKNHFEIFIHHKGFETEDRWNAKYRQQIWNELNDMSKRTGGKTTFKLSYLQVTEENKLNPQKN